MNRLPPLLRGETGAGVLPNTRLTPNWGGGLDLETVSTKHKRLTMTVMVDDNDDGDDDGVELGVSKLIDDHPADVFRVGARSVFYGSGHMGRHRPIYESSGLELPFWGCWRPILWEHCANAFVLDNFWTTSGKLSDKLWMTFVCLFPVLLRLETDRTL
jgi:hypothetical protein